LKHNPANDSFYFLQCKIVLVFLITPNDEQLRFERSRENTKYSGRWALSRTSRILTYNLNGQSETFFENKLIILNARTGWFCVKNWEREWNITFELTLVWQRTTVIRNKRKESDWPRTKFYLCLSLMVMAYKFESKFIFKFLAFSQDNEQFLIIQYLHFKGGLK